MNPSKSVISNFIWRFLERCGAQGVTFVVSLVLARLLAPELYGTVALINVFINILSVFINSGMGAALIQKKDADDTDYSSIFYFNLVMSMALYIILFFSAPLIAGFYGQPELTAYTRVIGITLIIAGVKNIQSAYVSRNLEFRRFFFATLGGTIGAAFLGIYMAVKGCGIWALIAQSLFNNAVDTIILWITVKWRPKKRFSFSRLKRLFSYGWKLLASSLLDTGYNNLRSLLIGKLYSSADLAFYNKGGHFPQMVISNINSALDSVLFPVMAREQSEHDRVRAITKKAIRVGTYLIMPVMMGLAVCARPLIQLLLTEKWMPCVPFLRIFCFCYAFWPIHTANLNAMKAVGRSDLFLKLEIIKKIIGLTALICTARISVEAMAYALMPIEVLDFLINAWPNRKLIGYGFLDQLRDLLPALLLSCAMGAAVYSVGFLGLEDWLTLLIQIPLGIILYLLGSILFRIDSFAFLLSAAREIMTD